jgi:hypothetical protein
MTTVCQLNSVSGFAAKPVNAMYRRHASWLLTGNMIKPARQEGIN